MSINVLLRASLESHRPSTIVSMEDYLEYRDALEEYATATGVADKLHDLTDEIVEIEAVVEESRAAGALTDDQVAIHTKAISDVRSIVTGDEAEISLESFASLEAASLHASVESKGLLSRMWEGFKAMLAAIRDAIKKAWRWLVGSSKRTEEAAKEVKEAAKEVENLTPGETKEVTEQAEETHEWAKEFQEALHEGVIEDLVDGVKEASRSMEESRKAVEEAEREGKASDENLSSVVNDIKEKESGRKKATKEKTNKLLESLEGKLRTLGREARASKTAKEVKSRHLDKSKGGDTKMLSDSLTELSKELTKCAPKIKDLTSLINTIDKEIARTESLIKSAGYKDLVKEMEIVGEMGIMFLRDDIVTLNKFRGMALKFMKTGDNIAVKSKSVASKVNKSNPDKKPVKEHPKANFYH